MTPERMDAFVARFHVEPNTGCWLWTGAATANGYGVLPHANDEQRTYAHRASFEHFVGPVARGLNVCHRCDTPACVNPEHLFLGTQKDNMRDCSEKGRCRSGDRGKAQTHCKHGHEYTPENTQYKPNGCRRCRTCTVARKREKRQRAGAASREKRRTFKTEGATT